MSARPAILTPSLDLLCVGGLSILLLFPLAFVSPVWVDDYLLEWIVIGTVVINFPHIMGSYRLLYSSSELVKRHPWAAIRIPLLLGMACLGALVLAARGVSVVPVTALHLASVGYLAVHYVGQTWGMMMSFAQVEGVPFSDEERRPLLWSLRFILAWHLSWVATHFLPVARDSEAVDFIYETMTAGIPMSMAVGAYVLVQHAQRHGRKTPLRILVPWLANHVWYLLMAMIPAAAPAVQVAHALQYLPFVARVEMNRADAEAAEDVVRWARRKAMAYIAAGALCFFILPHWMNPRRLPLWVELEPATVALVALPLFVLLLVMSRRGGGAAMPVHLLSLAVVLLVAGGLAFWFLAPAAGLLAVEALGVNESMLRTGTTVGAFLGLHHYITDGVLWKLREPHVRKQLFAHLAPGS
ncbi:MAG: hypothetical protein AB8G23_12720 [Myxococcota bacterium]